MGKNDFLTPKAVRCRGTGEPEAVEPCLPLPCPTHGHPLTLCSVPLHLETSAPDFTPPRLCLGP